MIETSNPYRKGGDGRHPYKKDGEQPADPENGLPPAPAKIERPKRRITGSMIQKAARQLRAFITPPPNSTPYKD